MSLTSSKKPTLKEKINATPVAKKEIKGVVYKKIEKVEVKKKK